MRFPPPPGSAASDSTSSSLLERVKARDPGGWSKLSQIYGPLVYGWARRAGLQASDAADVTQEVFRAVATNVAAFRRERPGDSFQGWLWTIARNKIRDHYRRRSTEPQAEGGSHCQARFANLPDALSADESIDAASQSLVNHRFLELVRAEFETRTWQAFWLTAVESRSAADVAQELGMSLGAVYVAKSRVLARIRQEAAGLAED